MPMIRRARATSKKAISSQYEVTAVVCISIRWRTDKDCVKRHGLTAANAASTGNPPARWKAALADIRARTDIVDGDRPRLRSQWQDSDGQFGFLMGESNPQDPAQRVYGFGKTAVRRGTIWRISRPADECRTPERPPDG